MKIAIINNLYKPLDRGGAEKVCERLADDLRKLNHEVFIITTKPKDIEVKKTNDKVYHINSNYYHLGKHSLTYRLFWHILSFFDFKKMDEVGKIFNKERPDIVITNNIIGLSPLIFLNIRAKHVHILHDIQLLHPSGLMFSNKEHILNTLPAKIYQKINKKLISSPDLIVSPSKWLLREYENKKFFPDSKRAVIRNPKNKKTKERKRVKRETTSFIFIGQIEKHKGISLLLKAWEKIDKEKCKLTIVGDGSCLEKIKEDYTNIRFTGRLKKEGVEEELSKSDCLIMPSLCYDNSPGVIYEASSFNIPVIASNIGGAVELVEEYKGLLFEAGNEKDLKDKIEEMHENIDKYLEEEAKEIGEENYAEKIIKKAVKMN